MSKWLYGTALASQPIENQETGCHGTTAKELTQDRMDWFGLASVLYYRPYPPWRRNFYLHSEKHVFSPIEKKTENK
ncbi:hypothetical protein [Siminovitchia sp. 179-K 8D1 HS]|uniref:hypothetical protein n=1 Tax=Siminovitchia sp. 179-K 8D1 HS TaxID=3142385 RepID=UPI0039A066D1